MSATLDMRSMNAVPAGDKLIARALALVMHALFGVLLVIGVSWQHQPPAPVTADLWASLPSIQQPPPTPKVEPEDEPEPEPPKPVPRVKPTPPSVPKAEPRVPKAEPKPVAKPDIAISKKEKAPTKVEKAEPRKLDEDKALRDKKAADAREREMRKIIDAEREADAKAAAEKAARVASERAAKAAAPTVVSPEIQRYKDGIRNKVLSRYVAPADLTGAAEAEFTVLLLPGGELRDVIKRKSSGNLAYDAAAEKAIRDAQPFAAPSGADFQQYFAQFTMPMRPR